MAGMCWYCMTETMKDGVCTACHRAKSDDADPGILPPGTELDNGSVLIGEKLGQGGFGVTYIALDRQSNKRVALKEFRPNHMVIDERSNNALQVKQDKIDEYEKSLRSFKREARLLNALSHPNIVSVLFTIEENNTCYYGMELLQGQDLKHYILSNGVMDADKACQILKPVMQALAFIHSRKTLHRDISPDNIFLRNDPASPLGIDPCLIDFGAAYTAMDDFTHSATGVMKKGYSPIEQNMTVDFMGPHTDIYALCATLYYMTTGKIPPPSLERHLHNTQLESADKINHRLSPAFSKVLEHGLAIKWEDRIQNIPELWSELGSVFPELFPGGKKPDRHIGGGGGEKPPDDRGGTGGTGREPEVENEPVISRVPPEEERPGLFAGLRRLLKRIFRRKEPSPISVPVSVQPLAEFYCKDGCFRGHTFSLQNNMFFGRSPESHVPISDTTVSGQHFLIYYHDGKTILRDLKSTNGTFVNNIMLPSGGEKALETGDIIKVGQNNLFQYREKAATRLPE